MSQPIQKALYYIETHLDDELEIVHLAKVAGYSPYHFCRVFKTQVGESAMAYASRLRLEKSTLKMISQEKSIIEVALASGFKTPNGFNKAFKKIFGLTPTAYKYQRVEELQRYKEKMMQTPQVVIRDEAFVVYERQTGEYDRGSEIAWQNLSTKLNDFGKACEKEPPSVEMVLDVKGAELLGICHDDPNVTQEENIRYDAAIAWGKPQIAFLKKHGFETKRVAEGKYIMVTHKGSHKELIGVWMGLYAWIEENGYSFRDEPPFEKYLNMPMDTKQSELLTEIYVPVE
ncbi:MAG: AraC family transcriptional regulator [Epsilonproteobacteria bacterium]|nr:AraC family transcriptional regulator [Campylobacterota bacterium]